MDLAMNSHECGNIVSVSPAPIPTAAHADITAGLGLAPGPIIVDLAVDPTAENVGAEATATHPCPIAAGTSVIVYVLISTSSAASLTKISSRIVSFMNLSEF